MTLAPCPKCGSKPITYYEGNPKDHYQPQPPLDHHAYYCPGEKCGKYSEMATAWHVSQPAAFMAWNRFAAEWRSA